MHVLCEGLRHLLPADIRNGVQGQTVVDLVVVIQILANGVDNKSQEVRILVHEKGHSEVSL